MAERLGNGLQNRVQQFESAWYLLRNPDPEGRDFCFWRFLLVDEPEKMMYHAVETIGKMEKECIGSEHSHYCEGADRDNKQRKEVCVVANDFNDKHPRHERSTDDTGHHSSHAEEYEKFGREAKIEILIQHYGK